MCVFETNITLAADKYETDLKQRILATTKKLEALPVDDGRAGLVVLLLGNPHLLEGGQGGQDGASDPDRVPENVKGQTQKIFGQCHILTFSLVGQLS